MGYIRWVGLLRADSAQKGTASAEPIVWMFIGGHIHMCKVTLIRVCIGRGGFSGLCRHLHAQFIFIIIFIQYVYMLTPINPPVCFLHSVVRTIKIWREHTTQCRCFTAVNSFQDPSAARQKVPTVSPHHSFTSVQRRSVHKGHRGAAP